jgi:LacI family repressor for deo operon, udp, cdd, tsx, nupC, and nupG
MGATLKDVAREAGVSHMTVSRVINDKNNISISTRRKVLSAVERLGYKPNSVARSLVSKKTKVLGIIVPDIDNPFFSGMVKVVERASYENGHNIMLGDTNGTIENEKLYIEIMRERMVDGLILAAPRMDDESIELCNESLPTVVIDRKLERERCSYIWADDRSGAVRAMEYLISSGHRRIGFISGPENVQVSSMREQGYRESLERHGILFDPELVVRGDFYIESGYRSLDHFLAVRPCPTAIFSANDLMACGLLKRAMERGIAIPESLSLVGFDNIQMSELINPPLTTISHPITTMADEAVSLLFEMVQGGKRITKSKRLENKLIVRDSVGEVT